MLLLPFVFVLSLVVLAFSGIKQHNKLLTILNFTNLFLSVLFINLQGNVLDDKFEKVFDNGKLVPVELYSYNAFYQMCTILLFIIIQIWFLNAAVYLIKSKK